MLENDGLSIFGETKSKDALLAMAGIGQGRNYYVNNITGSASANGLSWSTAMDEISTATTASEAYRILPAATNEFIRNTIFVQGTGTPYTALTALPSYCNIIGLGADVRGNGAGIARVGADTGTGYGVVAAGTIRGLNVYNIQFQAGQNNYMFKAANLYRCVFDNCGFITNGDPTSSPETGFSVGKASGLVIRNSHWGSASGINSGPDCGFDVTSTHFHLCLIENCHIEGSVAVIRFHSTCLNAWSSEVRNNTLGGSGYISAIGVDDNATTGMIVYSGNMINATVALNLADNPTGRIPGNMTDNAFVTNT